MSSENITSRLCSLLFKAILRQEVGWFDKEMNSSSVLINRLSEDAAKIQGATGACLVTITESIFQIAMAIIICFAYEWLLTILILGVLPFMVIGNVLKVKILSGHTAANKKGLKPARKVRIIL